MQAPAFPTVAPGNVRALTCRVRWSALVKERLHVLHWKRRRACSGSELDAANWLCVDMAILPCRDYNRGTI